MDDKNNSQRQQSVSPRSDNSGSVLKLQILPSTRSSHSRDVSGLLMLKHNNDDSVSESHSKQYNERLLGYDLGDSRSERPVMQTRSLNLANLQELGEITDARGDFRVTSQ